MPCSQRVRVTYDKNKNPKKYELICAGKCDDGKDCKRKEVTEDKTHITREFCVCDDGKEDEFEKCHIVLYTVTTTKGKKVEKEQYFKCEFKKGKECPAKKKCAPRPVGNQPFADDDTKTKMEWIEFECECVPEDEVWPEKK